MALEDKKKTVTITREMRETCHQLMQGLRERLPEMQLAVVTTVDGRLVEAFHRHSGDNIQRAAAFTSSLLALCESFAREIKVGLCQHLTLSAEKGNIVIARVKDARQLFVLGVVADPGANLANVLRATHDWSAKIGASLNAG